MRHGKRRTKLSMMSSHRKAMLKNMVRNLLKHQKIQTTLRRAKETRRLADHLITVGKTDSVASRRLAYVVLNDRDLVGKLFKEIAPLFKSRNGGYTRIIPLGFRRGDGATMAILEFTEKKMLEKPAKKAKAKEVKAEPAPEAKAVEPKPHKEKAPEAEAKHKEVKEEPKPKAISKSKPTLAEEKRTEKGKAEDKKIGDKKKFLANLRGFFRRKSDM